MEKSNKNIITVASSEIIKIHRLFSQTNFELKEVVLSNQGKEIEVWTNSDLNKVVKLTLQEDTNNTENSDRLISEVIDLWIELRAIREALEDYDEQYFMKPEVKQTSYEQYFEKVKEFEETWEETSYMKKIFKKNIDPSILAYLDLNDDIKNLITN